MSTREERIKARQERWATPRQVVDPLRPLEVEKWKALAKLSTLPEWDALKVILDDCARYRIVPIEEANWDVKTASVQGEVSLARRLVTLVEEAPDRLTKLMTDSEPKEGAA